MIFVSGLAPDAASTYLYSIEFLLPPTLIVMRLAALGLYEKALTTARALKVDMTDIFAELVVHCLRLTSNSDDSM